MSNSEVRPVPCDRIYELRCDGEVWKAVKKCDIKINQALNIARQHAEELETIDGNEHTYGIHLRGVVNACPTED